MLVWLELVVIELERCYGGIYMFGFSRSISISTYEAR